MVTTLEKIAALETLEQLHASGTAPISQDALTDLINGIRGELHAAEERAGYDAAQSELAAFQAAHIYMSRGLKYAADCACCGAHIARALKYSGGLPAYWRKSDKAIVCVDCYSASELSQRAVAYGWASKLDGSRILRDCEK